jgi:uncharacterized protein
MLWGMDHSALRDVLAGGAEGVTLKLKVVPGASKTAISGLLGNRVKVTVAAAAESGKANRAVCKLLADIFGLPVRNVCIIAGATQPRKTAELAGLSLCAAADRLGTLLRW